MDKLLCMRSPEMDKLASDVREAFMVLTKDMQDLQPFRLTVMRGDYADSIWVNFFVHGNEDDGVWTEQWCDIIAEEIIQTFEDWDFPEDYHVDFTRNYTINEFLQVAFYIYDGEVWDSMSLDK